MSDLSTQKNDTTQLQSIKPANERTEIKSVG